MEVLARVPIVNIDSRIEHAWTEQFRDKKRVSEELGNRRETYHLPSTEYLVCLLVGAEEDRTGD